MALLDYIAQLLANSTKTNCPRCDAPATIEDLNGEDALTWWRCWNGHRFTISTRLIRQDRRPRRRALERAQ